MYEWIKLENWICNFFVWKVLSEILKVIKASPNDQAFLKIPYWSISGINLINKKIIRILIKFSDFPQIFKLCSYQNIRRKIFRNLSSQLHQIFCQEISQIFWKNWWVRNSQIFIRKFIRTQIFIYRINLRRGF